jgi:hypothetical protein
MMTLLTGGSLKAEGFGDGLLTSIKYRASSIETRKFLKFHFAVHIISFTDCLSG